MSVPMSTERVIRTEELARARTMLLSQPAHASEPTRALFAWVYEDPWAIIAQLIRLGLIALETAEQLESRLGGYDPADSIWGPEHER
jgi:hypothetical protein